MLSESCSNSNINFLAHRTQTPSITDQLELSIQECSYSQIQLERSDKEQKLNDNKQKHKMEEKKVIQQIVPDLKQAIFKNKNKNIKKRKKMKDRGTIKDFQELCKKHSKEVAQFFISNQQKRIILLGKSYHKKKKNFSIYLKNIGISYMRNRFLNQRNSK